MNIEDYLKKYAITKRGFSRRLGITESALYKIISGINSPRKTTAQEIVELTNSEVTFEDLFKKK
jgi:predicted transcriptional regulator